MSRKCLVLLPSTRGETERGGEEQAGGAGEDTAAKENGVRVVVGWVTGNLIKDRMIVTLIGGHLSGAETCVPCSWGAL